MIKITIAFLLAMNYSQAGSPTHLEHVRQILLNSRHIGAHGEGYNSDSLKELSGNLSSSDIPDLLQLYRSSDMRVGVIFALASLCQPGKNTVLQAVKQGTVDETDATDCMRLISVFDHCDDKTRRTAISSIPEIKKLADERNALARKHSLEEDQKDKRIQKNSLKILDPNQAKTLSQEEREEVFRRSVKAAGLDGPRTPAQEEMYQRMYSTMVLGKPSKPSANQQQ